MFKKPPITKSTSLNSPGVNFNKHFHGYCSKKLYRFTKNIFHLNSLAFRSWCHKNDSPQAFIECQSRNSPHPGKPRKWRHWNILVHPIKLRFIFSIRLQWPDFISPKYSLLFIFIFLIELTLVYLMAGSVGSGECQFSSPTYRSDKV